MPNLADRGVDAVFDVDEHVLAPQMIGDVGARDELLPTLHQQDEEVHRLPFQLHGQPSATQLAGGDVELEVEKAIRLVSLGLKHRFGQRR